jgi:hypothetical protein
LVETVEPNILVGLRHSRLTSPANGINTASRSGDQWPACVRSASSQAAACMERPNGSADGSRPSVMLARVQTLPAGLSGKNGLAAIARRVPQQPLGIVAGAPLGGLVEADPEDRYGLARALIHPLRPWLRQVRFHGPLQVTAAWHQDRWWVLEYNVRLGVTSGAMLLRMLQNPWETMLRTAQDQTLHPQFVPHRRFGCSVTLAGYGYPYVQLSGPELPLEIREPLDTEETDLWWNEVRQDDQGRLWATGHRLADLIGFGPTLETARRRAYANIARLHCPGSYYRTDIGQSLWPPGSA